MGRIQDGQDEDRQHSEAPAEGDDEDYSDAPRNHPQDPAEGSDDDDDG
jgi:hypothetical protein